MYKHEIRFCKCGRIHAFERGKLDDAIKANKNILLICAGCGGATVIGADIEPDLEEPEKDCYVMYAWDFSPYKYKCITVADFSSTQNTKGIKEIIYSHGHQVPMMTGMDASGYCNGKFFDQCYPDFYKIQHAGATVEEVMKFIDDFNRDRVEVNMARFIRETPEYVLDMVSQCYIDGFDWRGTKWERSETA